MSLRGRRTARGSRSAVAGALIVFGLGVSTATLFWNHPVSLFAFLALGVLPAVGGIGLYLAEHLR